MNIDHIQPTSEVTGVRIAELEERWNNSLKYIENTLYPNTPNHGAAGTILAEESQRHFQRHPGSQIIVGVSGPGAAGKGTATRFITDELGYSKVVNTTTREKREGEIDGIDYFFTDRSQFTTAQNLGHFALTLERVGRGMYGISHDEITRKLSEGSAGCVIEENPENIMELFDTLQEPDTQAILLYILPKHPIIKHSLERLQHRLSFEADPTKQIITREVFESTLGDRQIDEFNSLSNLPKHPNITPLFIVNDDLDEAKAIISKLLGDNDATN